MTSKSNLAVELQEFHGTENYYKHSLIKNIHYTDGVKYMAETADAFWLIDIVVSYQTESKIRDQHFQVYSLKVNDDRTAKVTITDGNDNVLASQEIEFTDFPIDEISIWCVDGIILLPSEY